METINKTSSLKTYPDNWCIILLAALFEVKHLAGILHMFVVFICFLGVYNLTVYVYFTQKTNLIFFDNDWEHAESDIKKATLSNTQ